MFLFSLVLITWHQPVLAQEASGSNVGVGPSSSTTSSGGGFDPSPHTLDASVTQVDAKFRKLFLSQPGSPEIEMDVPPHVPIYSAEHKQIQLKNISRGSFVHVRYHPLTVSAMDIQVLSPS